MKIMKNPNKIQKFMANHPMYTLLVISIVVTATLLGIVELISYLCK